MEFSYQIFYEPGQKELAILLQKTLSMTQNAVESFPFHLKPNPDPAVHKMFIRRSVGILVDADVPARPYLLPESNPGSYSFFLLDDKPEYFAQLKFQIHLDRVAANLYFPGMKGDAPMDQIVQRLIAKSYHDLGLFPTPEVPENIMVSDLLFLYDVPQLISCDLRNGEKTVLFAEVTRAKQYRELQGTYWLSRYGSLTPTGNEYPNWQAMVREWFRKLGEDELTHIVHTDRLYENIWHKIPKEKIRGAVDVLHL